MKNIFKKNRNKGYAILFAVIIVSAISVITAGLTNTAYKQLVLSSLAEDSQAAFYQADTAGDCALYSSFVELNENDPNVVFTSGGEWTCGGADLDVTMLSNGGYTISPQDEDSNSPCFRIDVVKTDTTDVNGNPATENTISARGYNICDISNTRTVEREIQIVYTKTD
jgi:hypothetical protein